jgi:uncharacterized protein (TIGR03118 family)
MRTLFTALSMIAAFTLPLASASAESSGYKLTTLVANKAQYQPQILDKKLINAWGIAIRPAGAGGHFWVTGNDISFEYVGDVKASPDKKMRRLHADALKYVKLPVGGAGHFATGVVYIDSKKDFVITQEIKGKEPITAPSKFIFASDGGIISAWTERKLSDGSFDRSGDALAVIDQSGEGAQFFGLAVNQDYSRLYAADFGKNPGIKVFGGDFKPVRVRFDNPFDANDNGKVDAGEYAPFNIQALDVGNGKQHLFVTYAKTTVCPEDAAKKGECEKGGIWPGEEDSANAGSGRLAEFDEDGDLIAVWKDEGKLNAPWGLAVAPDNFGSLSGKLLVANFGDGTIAAFDMKTRSFDNFLRKPGGEYVQIGKIWGLIFGNGVSLGDKDALYYAAGPNDEKNGVFGSIRLAK